MTYWEQRIEEHVARAMELDDNPLHPPTHQGGVMSKPATGGDIVFVMVCAALFVAIAVYFLDSDIKALEGRVDKLEQSPKLVTEVPK